METEENSECEHDWNYVQSLHSGTIACWAWCIKCKVQSPKFYLPFKGGVIGFDPATIK